MQAIQVKAALSGRKRDEGALAFGEFLACQASRGPRLGLHASRGDCAPAAQALAKGPGLQAFQRGVNLRHFGGIAASQHLAPLAQDGSPTVNFFR